MANLSSLRLQLASLTAYRNILSLPVIKDLKKCLDFALSGNGDAALASYGDAYYALQEAGYRALADYLYDHLRYDSSPCAEMLASNDSDPLLEKAAKRDVEVLDTLSKVSGAAWGQMIRDSLHDKNWPLELRNFPCWEYRFGPSLKFEELTEFYQTHGAGLFSKYRAFLWQDGALHPIENPDYTAPEDLVGYRLQRDQVYANTAALLAGKQVNNVLLYGQSGTGKSATVKSLLGVPAFGNLRLIEVDKSQLAGIPDLIRMLGHRPQKFVLYIDDLAFDKDDQTYSLLKTILEGGLEPKPANVAIYATSNRRHLVRETFSDRAGDEIDAAETIEEKTSLSERFGLRIPYSALNQDQYLALCYELAEQACLTLPREELRAQAIRFNLRHPGRTPRVAQQFIHSLHGVTLEE